MQCKIVDAKGKKIVDITFTTIPEPSKPYAEEEELAKTWVIVYGGLGGGIQGIVGLFDSEEEAGGYAEGHNFGHCEKFVYEVETP